jgi:hypothetical protein
MEWGGRRAGGAGNCSGTDGLRGRRAGLNRERQIWRSQMSGSLHDPGSGARSGPVVPGIGGVRTSFPGHILTINKISAKRLGGGGLLAPPQLQHLLFWVKIHCMDGRGRLCASAPPFFLTARRASGWRGRGEGPESGRRGLGSPPKAYRARPFRQPRRPTGPAGAGRTAVRARRDSASDRQENPT